MIKIQHAWFIKLFLCGQMCFIPPYIHSPEHISQPQTITGCLHNKSTHFITKLQMVTIV